jgi:hypothetical protein
MKSRGSWQENYRQMLLNSYHELLKNFNHAAKQAYIAFYWQAITLLLLSKLTLLLRRVDADALRYGRAKART